METYSRNPIFNAIALYIRNLIFDAIAFYIRIFRKLSFINLNSPKRSE